MNEMIEFLKKNLIDVVLIMIFLWPLIKGFLFKFSSKNLKNDIEDVGSYSAFIIGSILGAYITKRIFMNHNRGIYSKIYKNIPTKFLDILQSKPIYIYIVFMPIIIFIIYKIIEIFIGIINRITIYPLLDGVERLLKEKSNFAKRIIGFLFQFPKAICYLMLTTFTLNIFSMIGIGGNYNKNLDKSVLYKFVAEEFINPITNSDLAKEVPNIINNSFKIVVKNDSKQTDEGSKGTIIYYNGVTLQDGIKSNKEINKFSKELVKNQYNTKDKAKKIYDWIGKNIEYDYDKADNILNNNFTIKSGAINTFYTKRGICFDYACLYAAMGKANGMKVRTITGEGFNGSSWVSHAWNQIYIEKEKRWINVDTTFYKGGNYFDSSIFNLDHKDARIAG